MKMRSLLLLVALLPAISCKQEINGPGIPSGLSYFAFSDKAKSEMLSTGSILLQSIDPTDSTVVLATQRLFTPAYIRLFSRTDGTQYFEFTGKLTAKNKGPIEQRQNLLRLVYSNNVKSPDWLEFSNTAEEWVNPASVRFNGKILQRITINEPVDGSFLYILP